MQDSSKPQPAESGLKIKMSRAYKDGRRLQELTDIELNRSKIVMLDQDGKQVKLDLFRPN